MDETGKPIPKDAEEFVAEETGGELSNPDDAEKTPSQESVEFQLTPEIEEKVMEKVRDILEYGTAFSGVGYYDEKYKDRFIERINSCLEHGLVGTVNRDKIDLTGYRKNLKLQNPIKVYFQIVGRTHKMLSSNDYKNNTYSFGAGSVSFVFDINKYQELCPGDEHISMPSWNFQANLGGNLKETPRETKKQNKWEKASEAFNQFNENGDIMVDPDFGFSLSPRVPPRFMEGLVVTRKKSAENAEDTKMLMEEVPLLVKSQLEVNKERSDLYLPIYDINGNLLWPQKMSYEEVKQFVADRDAKKAQSSSEQPQSESQEEPPIQPEELDEF